MDTRYLSYIIEIANEKNMRKASEKLFVSQPSLSQYLSKLELELGTPLFTRTKGELIPTTAGQMYVECAQKMLDMKRELYQNIGELTNNGHINLATTSIWSLKMISELIPRLKKEFPGISLELFEGNLKPAEKLLEEKSVDLAFVAINSLEKFEGFSELLGYEEILFAVPSNHPYCTSKNTSKDLTAQELSSIFCNENFILPRKDSTISHAISDFLSECKINTETVCSVNHMTTVSNMVENQVGVAFIPRTCMKPESPITYYSLSPKIYRLNAVIFRSDRALTKPEKRLIEMAHNYPLFRNT